MILECRNYLEEKVRAAMGSGTKVFHTYKELAACMESHVGSVLIDSEVLTRSGAKLAPMSSTDRTVKVYDREQAFTVTMGEYTLEALEPLYESLLGSLDRVITMNDGYGAALEVSGSEWLFKEDNILKSNVSVVVSVTCRGGLWKPLATTTIKDADIEVED